MKRQRRFSSEAQILKAIDLCRDRIKERKWEMDQSRLTSLELENLNKSITRLETRLGKLGEVLAAFRTQPMSFLEDQSVVM